MSAWSIQMKSGNLPMRQSIVLSCLIHERVDSFIHTGRIFSDVSGAALLVRSTPNICPGALSWVAFLTWP